MTMYNPPHPGEFIQEIYLEPFAITGRQLAFKLGVAPSTINRILKGRSSISSEMALRLSKALGRSPESWLTMQDCTIYGTPDNPLILIMLKRLNLRQRN